MKIQKLDLCMTKFFLKGFSRLELIPVLAASPSIYTSLLPQLLTQPSLFYFYTFLLPTSSFLLFYFFTFSKLDMTCPPSTYTPLSFSTSYATPSLSYYSTFYFLWVFKFRAETSLQHFSNWFDGVQTSLVLMSVDSSNAICSRPSCSLVLNQSALNCEVKAGGLALQLQICRVFCGATKLAVDALRPLSSQCCCRLVKSSWGQIFTSCLNGWWSGITSSKSSEDA